MWGAILGAAAGIGGAILSSKSGEHAAEDTAEAQRIQAAADERINTENILAQKEAQERSIGFQREQTDIARGDIAPWREAGGEALSELKTRVMRGAGEFRPEEDPGYEYGYKRFIEDPLMSRASAGGNVRSGGILKALSEGAADYATSKYDNFLDRWQRSLNPLQNLSGTGVSAGGASAGISSGFGSQGGNILSGYQTRTSPDVTAPSAMSALQEMRQADVYGNVLGTVGVGLGNYLDVERFNSKQVPSIW